MATKIIKAWVNGNVQEVEVEDIVLPEQEPTVEERVEDLEESKVTTDERLDILEDKPIITAGNLLVGNGTQELDEMTPEEILSHINGASVRTMTTDEYNDISDDEVNANTLYALIDGEGDENYYTKVEVDEKVEEINSSITGLASDTSVDSKINTHNTSESSHNDIRVLIDDLIIKLNNFLDIDDTTSDQLSEVLTLIENNRGTLESLTISKVNVSDIIDNLTTNNSDKVLSAAQGVAIKTLIDALQTEVDTKVSTDTLSNTLSDYYTKTEIDNLELITIDDIDAICGTTLTMATLSEVTF